LETGKRQLIQLWGIHCDRHTCVLGLKSGCIAVPTLILTLASPLLAPCWIQRASGETTLHVRWCRRARPSKASFVKCREANEMANRKLRSLLILKLRTVNRFVYITKKYYLGSKSNFAFNISPFFFSLSVRMRSHRFMKKQNRLLLTSLCTVYEKCFNSSHSDSLSSPQYRIACCTV
jgi:hypothetical protein